MFTIKREFVRRKHKRPATFINEKGERLPLVPFKPSYINLTYFAQHRDCSRIILEHPWLVNVKMFENPMLTDHLVKADYERLTIQLSTEVLEQDLSVQRDIFIRVLCAFLAQKLFGDMNEGEPYQLLVKRYITKTSTNIQSQQSHKTQ